MMIGRKKFAGAEAPLAPVFALVKTDDIESTLRYFFLDQVSVAKEKMIHFLSTEQIIRQQFLRKLQISRNSFLFPPFNDYTLNFR